MADCGCSVKLQKLLQILTDQNLLSQSEADAVWEADEHAQPDAQPDARSETRRGSASEHAQPDARSETRRGGSLMSTWPSSTSILGVASSATGPKVKWTAQPGGATGSAGPSRRRSRSRSPMTAPNRRASPVTDDVNDGDRSPSPASRPNCININNQQAGKCIGKGRWYVRRSSKNAPAGGRWQYACDVCAEWFEDERMIDQMDPLRKKDLE